MSFKTLQQGGCMVKEYGHANFFSQTEANGMYIFVAMSCWNGDVDFDASRNINMYVGVERG